MYKVVLGAALLATALFAAVRGDEAMYVGGTLQVPEKTEGRLDTSNEAVISFNSKKGSFEIPSAKISSIEYGQKVGRRVGAAVAVSPVLLLSKKKKHYVTVSYEDKAGTKQSAVFELSKGSLVSTVQLLEKRSGKKTEFESEEAKKHFENESK